MKLKAKVLISAGSNVGDRRMYLQNALRMLAEEGFSPVSCSSVYETPPWGFQADVPFYNVCFSGYTELSPMRFIRLLIDTEEKLGRVRSAVERYASRTIDLDIILWDRLLIHSPALRIPHPRAHRRRFVLEPAVEIEPDWIHPLYNQNLKMLLSECEDDAEAVRLFPWQPEDLRSRP